MKVHGQAYHRVQLSSAQAQKAQLDLGSAGCAQIFLEIEIIEMIPGLKALAWIWAEDGRTEGALRCCQLNPAQWAECMLLLQSGERPVYRISWQILGQLMDGCWGVSGGSLQEMYLRPAEHWDDLDQLVGIEAHTA